jgi:hypothetical protein
MGTAEVFDGAGRFVGNGADTRHVQDMGGGVTRIDVSFVGPFKHAGHYFIQDCGDHRVYQGPANIGYAETLAEGLVDANAYWAALGLSQRFFLMTLDNVQLSLALMSRGEQLIYAVVGQNDRVEGETPAPSLVSGNSYDFADDPTAGRGEILLHRAGTWSGELRALDGKRQIISRSVYQERVSDGLRVELEGSAFATETHTLQLKTNGWQAWTSITPQQESLFAVGSYSLSGGRALSGQFYYPDKQLRVWRREVVTHDGARKAVVHVWYRGGERVGVEFGVLWFERINENALEPQRRKEDDNAIEPPRRQARQD